MLTRALCLFALGVAAMVPLRRWVVEPISVKSGSMEPALPVGFRLFADKITLRFRPPRRGDIVLFPAPVGDRPNVGKRVIAVGGETLKIRGRKVYVDGLELHEPYAVYREGGAGRAVGPIKVPRGKVFVLGDNRDESEDATVWKSPAGRPIRFIPVTDITALVWPRL